MSWGKLDVEAKKHEVGKQEANSTMRRLTFSSIMVTEPMGDVFYMGGYGIGRG